MISAPSTFPDDPLELKKIIARISAKCGQYESENELLREQLRRLLDQLFGPKSEKLFGGSPQLLLFDMPEVDPEAETGDEEQIEVKPHARKKPGRKPLLENLECGWKRNLCRWFRRVCWARRFHIPWINGRG